MGASHLYYLPKVDTQSATLRSGLAEVVITSRFSRLQWSIAINE